VADVIALAALAFLAATLLPASSAAMLAGLIVVEAAPTARSAEALSESVK